MDNISITNRGPLRGEMTVPPDKSISHRAIMLSALADGQSRVRDFLYAEDPLGTLRAFRQMGVAIEEVHQPSAVSFQRNELIIRGTGLHGLSAPEGIIDCGNSGTTMRLLSGILAGQPFRTTMTGDASLRSRPMQRIITPLAEMGAVIESEPGGYPPLQVSGGNLKPITYRSPVASAQVKSAVLLAGLYCNGLTTVSEPGKSRDHTERMLAAGGVDVTVNGLDVTVQGNARLQPMDIAVPSDFSSAAFFIVAGLTVPHSEILIRNVGLNPTRSGLIDILRAMGASLETENERTVSGEPVADILVKHSDLKAADIGEELVLRAIDEFPILCIAAAKASGTTAITGAQELRVKESDRIAVMASALAQAGVSVEEREDGLIIEGTETLDPVVIDSHGDHRIAMAMAVAGLTASGETVIQNARCISTSFPGFTDSIDTLAGASP